MLPERFLEYKGDLLDYAITANALTYVQRAGRRKERGKYPLPEGIRLTKSILRLEAEGYAISDIATELHISVEEEKRILKE